MSSYKFDYKLEDISMVIEVKKDPLYFPHKHDNTLTPEDLNDLKSGKCCFYSLEITSIKNNTQATHFNTGYVMSKDPDNIADDLEDIMLNYEVEEIILAYWNSYI